MSSNSFSNPFKLALLRLIVWLSDCLDMCPIRTQLIFTKVRVNGITIQGDIKKMKIEFGQTVNVVATPQGAPGSKIEAGSAVFSFQAQDASGNDASADFVLTVDPTDELKCSLAHSGTNESTGLLTLTADGDPDADETAPVVGTLAIIVDAPNVTGFDMTGTVAP